MIKIYTDGCAIVQGGLGGYSCIVLNEGKEKIFSGAFRKTTNNRMELLAAIKGIESVEGVGKKIAVYSDSRYVVDSVMKRWVYGWVKKRFEGKKNKDLWLRFLELNDKHIISFYWVKGHNGDTMNERCDELAYIATKNCEIEVDAVYEYEKYNERVSTIKYPNKNRFYK